MTGGVAAILGPVGDNFGAGMSGGMAYVYDPENHLVDLINDDMVIYQRIEVDHYADELRALLALHFKNTQEPGSPSVCWSTSIGNALSSGRWCRARCWTSCRCR